MPSYAPKPPHPNRQRLAVSWDRAQRVRPHWPGISREERALAEDLVDVIETHGGHLADLRRTIVCLRARGWTRI